MPLGLPFRQLLQVHFEYFQSHVVTLVLGLVHVSKSAFTEKTAFVKVALKFGLFDGHRLGFLFHGLERRNAANPQMIRWQCHKQSMTTWLISSFPWYFGMASAMIFYAIGPRRPLFL